MEMRIKNIFLFQFNIVHIESLTEYFLKLTVICCSEDKEIQYVGLELITKLIQIKSS